MHKKMKFVKLGAGITALALGLTLTSGCDYKKRDKFYFKYNFDGIRCVDEKDYIDLEYINNYYLIELYHTVLKRSSLYIAYDFKFTDGTSKYSNIFTNYTIAYNPDNNDYYDFVNIIPLINLLEKYDFVKDKYTFEDMEYIFKIIKEDYEYSINKVKIKSKDN